ncbi:MAG: tetratricopeptide repeat protein [Roseburia sp.]|nr:tetratricopeptide repeat protein [Roseburia sp.]MCM1096483.1 tetratricopeptide repeat protein [Ruminococcus flavefaciens]
MDKTEIFQILDIEETKDEKALRDAYRRKLTVTNPEDDPEGFKRLRAAYEEACRLAKNPEVKLKQEERTDETPSGLWLAKAVAIYGSLRRRCSVEEWEELFDDDCFLSLEDEENCRMKLLRFLMDHFRLPWEVWKLLDKKLSITADAARLREYFPGDFIRYVINKIERGEDVEFSQFEGADDAPYDLYLQYYDRCWQALQQGDTEQAGKCIEEAEGLKIRHPILEICRADILHRTGREKEALELLERLREQYPEDDMIGYNAAEALWRQGDAENGGCRRRAAEIYLRLKEENTDHYMANVRLTEWYYETGQFQEAKKCAEKILTVGGSDEFMELLGKVNAELEKDLEKRWKEGDSGAALELCWCFLQDGKVCRGIELALKLEKLLPQEQEAEWNGLMSKLYVEEAEYEAAIERTRFWEEALKRKMEGGAAVLEREKDKDRLRQTHIIRMQCYHNLGYKDKDRFSEAIREGESVLEDSAKDIGVLLEMAQIYVEMQEYEKCQELVQKLAEDYQVYAAYATAMEAYRRQLNASGVIQTGRLCVQYFPNYAKAYEYMAKVYLDLNRQEDLEKVLADAEKNGVKSAVLEAYRFQKDHKPMELELLNNSLKKFRKDFRKPLEEGRSIFYENGLPILTKYLYHCPDSYLFVERGIFHRAGRHYEEALADFEKALAINPANPYAYNGLSFVYKYMGNYEKALFYIKKAILYMDKDMSPVIYTDLADLYSLLGCYEMALAACREYEERVPEDNSAWFKKQKAQLYVSLGRAEEAEELYEKTGGKYIWDSYEKELEAFIRCGRKEKSGEILRAWSERLGLGKSFMASLLDRGKGKPAPGRQEEIRYYRSLLWYHLAFGERADVEKALQNLRRYAADQEEDCEGRLADCAFACILWGMEKEGRKYGKALEDWLRKEKFAGRDKYFYREKAFLFLEILAAWYTKDEKELEELLGKADSCGVCHTCTCAVCRELEAARILFLLRRNRREEAVERLESAFDRLPQDEYRRALERRLSKT